VGSNELPEKKSDHLFVWGAGFYNWEAVSKGK